MLASVAWSALSSVILVKPEDLNFINFQCWLFDCLAILDAEIWGSHFWNSRIQVSWWCLDLPFLAVNFMSGGDPWCVSVRELPKDMASKLHHGRYDAWLRNRWIVDVSVEPWMIYGYRKNPDVLSWGSPFSSHDLRIGFPCCETQGMRKKHWQSGSLRFVAILPAVSGNGKIRWGTFLFVTVHFDTIGFDVFLFECLDRIPWTWRLHGHLVKRLGCPQSKKRLLMDCQWPVAAEVEHQFLTMMETKRIFQGSKHLHFWWWSTPRWEEIKWTHEQFRKNLGICVANFKNQWKPWKIWKVKLPTAGVPGEWSGGHWWLLQSPGFSWGVWKLNGASPHPETPWAKPGKTRGGSMP